MSIKKQRQSLSACYQAILGFSLSDANGALKRWSTKSKRAGVPAPETNTLIGRMFCLPETMLFEAQQQTSV